MTRCCTIFVTLGRKDKSSLTIASVNAVAGTSTVRWCNETGMPASGICITVELCKIEDSSLRRKSVPRRQGNLRPTRVSRGYFLRT